ncbi:DUF1127 domain-containing protein [Acerihabitans arboris]|uniref:DUF1127 domain-containing protein n=1 Tax=Acerihabitans arboris TaxID=2691583 RepID=A0A845SXS9_9GAMM|nr:DUF1127 domain-containing protein [Acerihabitans arboris]
MNSTRKTGHDSGLIAASQPERLALGKTGWWRWLSGRYQHWRSISRSRKALRSLDHAQLRDIGLTRDDLPYKDER